jgi:Tfp pilus assembly protein PilF
MSRRSGLMLLAIVVAVLPHLGCTSGPMPVRPADTRPPAGEAGAGGKAELPPDRAAEACLATARAMVKQGHDAEALAEYERALQYKPGLARELTRHMAVLYDRLGDREHAESAYAQALQAAPKDADLLNDVGYFHYECGDPQRAEKDLRRALEIDPKHRRAWVNLGVVLGAENRYVESYQAFAKVLTPAEARSNVGVILARQGRNEEAKQAFREALAQNPDLKPAKAILAVLEKPPTATAGAPSPPPAAEGRCQGSRFGESAAPATGQ